MSEQWNAPETTWLLNLWSALDEDSSEIGLGDWDENYLWKCEWDGLAPTIEPDNYLTFAIEANGNRTLYHRQTARVLMFAHDHFFDRIVAVPGCPEYTFYTIRRCPDLRAWIETVARQWSRWVWRPRPNYRAIVRKGVTR
jgi:hypothetical protein